MSQALDVSAAEASSIPLSRAEKRPTNATRSTFHVASGLVALALIALLPSRGWLVAASGAFAVAAWSMEIARRQSRTVNELLMRVFSPVAHAHERHEVNSSTWYVTALVLLAVLAPPQAAAVAVVVLAIGDPMAALVGRRYGRHRLASGRSLEGALTFVVTAGLAAWGALALIGAVPGSARVLVAAAGAMAGAAAELSSSRMDDNFTIPVASAAAATGAMALWTT